MNSSDEQENTTYLWVAETVLARQRRPLTAGEIVRIGLDDGLFGDKVLSKTPQKSMQARLSMEILKYQARSRFLRTGPGRFFLRTLIVEKASDLKENELTPCTPEEYVAPRRVPLPPTERVLVVAREDYEDVLDFQGIDFSYDQIVKRLLSARSLKYMSRAQAETDDEHKQFITYTLIQLERQLLSFRRGNYNRAPSIIRGARCIGFGGHVNEDDLSLFTYDDHGIRANAAREISEEIRIDAKSPRITADDIEPVGILNDDSSEVGKRHFALILRYTPSDRYRWSRPTRGEASINDLRWIRLDRNLVNIPDFEYWSQLCLRRLFPSDASGTSSYHIRRRSVFSKRHTLCVVGTIGSGKSITTSIIQEMCGHSVINTGRVLADILGIPSVPTTPRDVFQMQAKHFIEREDGPQIFAERIAQILDGMRPERTIIDGIRHPGTLEHLRRMSQLPLATVYVQTPPDIAFDLYRRREQSDTSLADFMKLLNGPSETSVRYLISEADAVLYNWHGLDGYKKVIRAFVEACNLGRKRSD